MKTRTINIYSFNELSEKAKERAIDQIRARLDYPWEGENSDSLKGFCEALGVRFRDVSWEYDTCSGHAYLKDSLTWENDEGETLTGKPLADVLAKTFDLSGSCPFTGFYMDEVLLNPIRAFIAAPDDSVNINNIVKDCLSEWADACSRDMKCYFSDESIAEIIECNGYEFTEEGELA